MSHRYIVNKMKLRVKLYSSSQKKMRTVTILDAINMAPKENSLKVYIKMKLGSYFWYPSRDY